MTPGNAAAKGSFTAAITASITVMAEAKAIIAKTGQLSGSLPCPICGGTVRWSAINRKRHTRGECTTSGDVGWIE